MTTRHENDQPQPGRGADHAIEGRLAELYDVFVDWPARLSREMPGIQRHLDAAGAKRVLDVGCGTGQHVRALREAGYEAHGCDASSDMLEQARALVDDLDAHFWRWRIGEPPPKPLRHAGPFDAITCMGNVWPQVTAAEAVARAAADLRDLLRPGGVAVLGLKAVAVRRERGEAYMPLLKRQFEGRAIYFIRFVDFDVAGEAGGDIGADEVGGDHDGGEPDVCDFHMTIVRGSADEAASAELHEARRLRVWSPEGLHRTFGDAGFDPVHITGKLADEAVEPTGEDVFVIARRPGGEAD